MYKTKIKEKYQDGFYTDSEYCVICDFDVRTKGDNPTNPMVLLFDTNNYLLSDIYKNKIEDAKPEELLDSIVVVKAKKEQYEIEYGINGVYYIVGAKNKKVIIKPLHGEGDILEVFPSRLVVVDYDGKDEEDENSA